MYAIIKDGGKQYKVSPGQCVHLEKKDAAPGTPIELTEVIYYQNKQGSEVGTPLLNQVKVKGVVEKHVKGDKIIVFKFRRRKDSRRKRGHRQQYTRVRIQQIVKE